MSETATNPASDDTLIQDSQLSGFAAFRERLGFCCCRIFKRTSKYDLSSISKDIQDQQDKPSYVNQGFQVEKQQRKDKLEKIAKTLPGATYNETPPRRIPNSSIQTPTRSITNLTPRSGTNISQSRPPTNTPTSKTGLSTVARPSPLAANTKPNKQDETTTDESSEEEENSSEDDKSSDSDSPPPTKRAPPKSANKRR